MCAVCLVLWIVDSFHLLALAFWIVGDNEFHWVEHGAYTASLLVQVFTNRSLQKCHVVEGIKLGVADAVDKHADALW